MCAASLAMLAAYGVQISKRVRFPGAQNPQTLNFHNPGSKGPGRLVEARVLWARGQARACPARRRWCARPRSPFWPPPARALQRRCAWQRRGMHAVDNLYGSVGEQKWLDWALIFELSARAAIGDILVMVHDLFAVRRWMAARLLARWSSSRMSICARQMRPAPLRVGMKRAEDSGPLSSHHIDISTVLRLLRESAVAYTTAVPEALLVCMHTDAAMSPRVYTVYTQRHLWG